MGSLASDSIRDNARNLRREGLDPGQLFERRPLAGVAGGQRLTGRSVSSDGGLRAARWRDVRIDEGLGFGTTRRASPFGGQTASELECVGPLWLGRPAESEPHRRRWSWPTAGQHLLDHRFDVNSRA